MPQSLDAWRTRTTELLEKAPLKVHITSEHFATAEEARRIVSDTIGGSEDQAGEDSLSQIKHPLGRVWGGRKTSPLRFRVIPIANCFHIAAVWDDRTMVTGNQTSDLARAVHLLQVKGKKLGTLLQKFA
jgi:hypothetical protein